MVELANTNLGDEEHSMLGDATSIAEANGCSRCYNTGYSGRVGLLEVMPVTKR